jgi:hypothetical protein
MKKRCKNCGDHNCWQFGSTYSACKAWRKKLLTGRQVLNRIEKAMKTVCEPEATEFQRGIYHAVTFIGRVTKQLRKEV